MSFAFFGLLVAPTLARPSAPAEAKRRKPSDRAFEPVVRERADPRTALGDAQDPRPPDAGRARRRPRHAAPVRRNRTLAPVDTRDIRPGDRLSTFCRDSAVSDTETPHAPPDADIVRG